MKRSVLIICLLAAFSPLSVLRAQYDFSYRSPEGQTLYYQVLPDGKSLRVTHPEREWPYYAGSKPVGKVTVPGVVQWNGAVYEVVEIGEYAFYGCDSLTAVYPGFVRSIGTQAFCGCKRLETIELNASVHVIGEGAFAYCKSLETMLLPDEVEHIGISAFSMCTGLREVVMIQHVEDVCDLTTFYGCPLMKDPKNRKKDDAERIIWRFPEVVE